MLGLLNRISVSLLAAMFVAQGPTVSSISATGKVVPQFGRTGKFQSIYCDTLTNCVGVGELGISSPFISKKRAHGWSAPIKVGKGQGLTTASLVTLDCSSVDNCVAGGFGLSSNSPSEESLLYTENAGKWNLSNQGTRLNRYSLGNSHIVAASCAPDGTCTVVGNAETRVNHGEPFAWSESKGVWSTPKEFDSTIDMNGGSSLVEGIRCLSGNSCVIEGEYTGPLSHGRIVPFVVVKFRGSWETPRLLSVSSFREFELAESPGGSGGLYCTSTKSCLLVGVVATAEGNNEQTFSILEKNGDWEQPHFFGAGLGENPSFVPAAMSCKKDYQCVLVGWVGNPTGTTVALIETIDNGKWNRSVLLDVLAADGRVEDSGLQDVSCSPDNCWAVGWAQGVGSSGALFLPLDRHSMGSILT